MSSPTVATQHANLSALPVDQMVPSRDQLLDPAFVHELLAAELISGAAHGSSVIGARLVRVAIVRVKYRIGESLRVTYRLGLEDHTGSFERTVTVRTFEDGGASQMTKASRSAVATPPLRPVLHHQQTSSVWWTLPNDRRLMDISSVLQSDGDFFTRLGLHNVGVCEVVEYAAERSITVRVGSKSGGLLGFLKHYVPGSVDVGLLAERYGRTAAWLRASGFAVRSPEVVAMEGQTLVLEPMPGVPWATQGMGEVPLVAGSTELLGRAIGAVHGTPLDGTDSAFERLRDERIMRSAEIVGFVRQDLSARCSNLAARLVEQPRDDHRRVLLHGDCHPGNMLIDHSTVSLIDLDQGGLGHPAADIGSLVARLHRAAILGDIGAQEARRAEEAFIRGYAEAARPVDYSIVAWHTAAALLVEQCVRAVNRVRPRQIARLELLIERAEQVLGLAEPATLHLRRSHTP